MEIKYQKAHELVGKLLVAQDPTRPPTATNVYEQQNYDVEGPRISPISLRNFS